MAKNVNNGAAAGEEMNGKILEILEANGKTEIPTTLRECELGDRRFLFPSFQIHDLRGMKVAESNAITSRKKNKDGEGLNEILKNCSHGETVIDWLIGDRTFAMLQIKRLSHGDHYDFTVPCPHCGEFVAWSEDLGSLKVKFLQEPGKTSGFPIHLPLIGRDLTFRLLDGKDERKLTQLRRNNDEELQAALMLFRTETIEGERMKRTAWFNELEAMDQVTFNQEVEAKDCGVDTTIRVDCDNCFRPFETELPMGLDFFLPRKISTKQRS